MHAFQLDEPESIPSPTLIFSLETIRSNLRRMLELAGSPARLRPHMKTHKTREITKLYLDHGITHHKCATLAEAKVLAECGVTDVLIAYPIVGPNQRLVCDLAKKFPGTRFSVIGDTASVIHDLATWAGKTGVELGLYLDVNVGQDRTGLSKAKAEELVPSLMNMTGSLKLRGLHLYDGNNTSVDPKERDVTARATAEWGLKLRDRLSGGERLELVFGGTPALQTYSQLLDDPDVTLSPGTCILHDVGYGGKYPELGFAPAAAVLTRCISRPGGRLVTFDVGTKAICSDPPAGQRCVLLGLESAKAVLHNEEHLVLETDDARSWNLGDVTYAMPMHICPTVAMFDFAYVVAGKKIVTTYEIAARGRLVASPGRQ